MRFWSKLIMNKLYITVTQLNRDIKRVIDLVPEFKDVQITGEISNLKIHQSGHWYFTLKDETSRISAVMFASKASSVRVKVKDGDKVNLVADVSVYETNGNYQLYVTKLEPAGAGNLYLEFEKLKKKLAEEGLFSDTHKISLPRYPNRIGVISAPRGAVVKDIITTTKRRWPFAELIIIPTLVQGQEAAKAIVNALKMADTMNFDVIICGRGGGSIEDLWPFNEEIVARQIYETKTPIVSAVGHETDYTIADFVADVRAPTPTAAAELVTPNRIEVMASVKSYLTLINTRFINNLSFNRNRLETISKKTIFTKPEMLYVNKRLQLDNLHTKLIRNQELRKANISNKINNYYLRISNSIKQQISLKTNSLQVFNGKLSTLGPTQVLDRGYAIIRQDDQVLSGLKDMKLDKDLMIQMKDGKIIVKPIKKG
jgi:exodeoxyribonuclease VII large subunit